MSHPTRLALSREAPASRWPIPLFLGVPDMRTRVQLFLGLVLAAVLATAGAGAACVPQPLLLVQPAASGSPGAKLTAMGTTFGTGPAEVRWNALDGPLLGTGTGPDFSVELTVPDVPDGLYTLVGIARSSGGGIAGTARATLRVVRADGEDSQIQREETAPGEPAGRRNARSPAPVPVVPLGAGGLVLLGLGGLLGRLSTSRRPTSKGKAATEGGA